MHRLIIVGLLAMSLFGCVSIADHAKPQRLPIVDFHTHLNGDMETARLLDLMNQRCQHQFVADRRPASADSCNPCTENWARFG